MAFPVSWYQGRSIESSSRTAASAARRWSGSRRGPRGPARSCRDAGGGAQRREQRVGVVLGDRAQLALEREPPVLGGPLAHVLEVVLDRLGVHPVLLVEDDLRLRLDPPRV